MIDIPYKSSSDYIKFLCYTATVQTSFYVSGFLYSLKTHKILLLESKQIDDATSLWSTLGGESEEGEEAQVTFQRILNKLLNLKVEMKRIYPVYDYYHDTLDKVNYVFYAEVKIPQKFSSYNGKSFSWLGFNETFKLIFPAHTKQDIIVGERVISAKWRQDEAKITWGV